MGGADQSRWLATDLCVRSAWTLQNSQRPDAKSRLVVLRVGWTHDGLPALAAMFVLSFWQRELMKIDPLLLHWA